MVAVDTICSDVNSVPSMSLKTTLYVEFDTNLIRVKTKEKIVKITGDKLVLKYINEGEIGIKGIINSLEFTD